MHTPSRRIDVVVIGAGHSGLAMSRVLGRHGVDHVVLERGEAAHSWRTQRWDSLRLLTPNWMTRLPGCDYEGDDPHGYMSAAEVAGFIAAYARRVAAPLHTHTTVTAVQPEGELYRVTTDRGDWLCRAVVLASGAFGRPVLPRVASLLPPGIAQLTAHTYRRPDRLDDGRVLIVGASATGVQLAQEIQRSGRPVTLAAGEHVRLPRVYRGRDIQWWMLAAGVLDQRIEDVDDAERARRVPSPQLAGTPERATLDLNALRADGVEVVGRLAGIRDRQAQFSGSLRNVCALADLKMNRLLETLDAWALRLGLDAVAAPPERFAPTDVGPRPRLGLALGTEVRTVIWATGFRPELGWLQAPVFGADGSLRHDRGVVRPGLVVLGLPYLRRRKSSFIHGAEDDVRELAAHVVAHLEQLARPRAAAVAA
ncbi:MAG: NAD(P)-binding domain-containing protein [Piscinibacter sp.]|nr:NAD(P)-binding domain-containing protein [Piscinibacter sp.]